MGGPATTSTSNTAITSISLPFSLDFFTDTLHSAVEHHAVKVVSEVRESHSEEPCGNKLTFISGKQKGLFKFTMIKYPQKCFSFLGNTSINRLKRSPCTSIQKELLSKQIWYSSPRSMKRLQDELEKGREEYEQRHFISPVSTSS